ncbi:hypothetical protein OEA41_000963 [Lepraria neglecta]|uniref:Uncharacterized protein n=1 Tax=Lepraria neglecta TaxID=209136 RepID=A0AAE0DPZ4_9LECA|nr:hypothetical protein OEA41_000963 [Lepraria neglecta]
MMCEKQKSIGELGGIGGKPLYLRQGTTKRQSSKALTTFKALPLPSGKKDTSYLERTEQLHFALSTFWSETRKGHGLDDIQFEMHLLSADTDPEHIKALEQEREEILAMITGIKSRPQQLQQPNAREIAEISAEDSNQEERVSQATRIAAKQRKMDILSYMFPATGSETPPAKTIDWDSFISAMTDVGFSARHGGGSALIFEAEDAQKGRSSFTSHIMWLR